MALAAQPRKDRLGPSTYLRTISRRNADGSVVRYHHLAEGFWDPEKRHAVVKVVHCFGRADQIDQSLQPVHEPWIAGEKARSSGPRGAGSVRPAAGARPARATPS